MSRFGPPRRSLWDRMQDKFYFSCTGCWVWTGAMDSTGYGRVASGGRYGRVLPAHRAMYELLVAPVDSELDLDHKCRVRNCINPAHLEPVTRRVNILRGVNQAAVNAKKTHCRQGHEFSEQNTYWEGRKRHCKTCRRKRVREHARRRRASS